MVLNKQKDVFVISDLHIGDGSAKDNLVKSNKEQSFWRLLDYIDSQNGQVVIAGDFLELWRHRLDDIVDRWEKLLTRVSQMDVSYVLGNHDVIIKDYLDKKSGYEHPLFEAIRPPFVSSIGGRRFKFMHGHEVDPFIASGLNRYGYLFGRFMGMLEFREDMCIVTHDASSDVMLEAGEKLIRLWKWINRSLDKAVQEQLFGLDNERMAWLKRPIRTRNMLSRFFKDKTNGFYDIAIVGHTHKAGRFSNWYFNSGCWTQNHQSFLRIRQDGSLKVLDWTDNGPIENPSIVCS